MSICFYSQKKGFTQGCIEEAGKMVNGQVGGSLAFIARSIKRLE
mgnify:CR=1 FL=1